MGYNPSSGMFVVIPQHILHQSKLSDTAFINIGDYEIDNFNKQFKFFKPFRLDNLPVDFQRPDLVIFHGCYFVEYIAIYKELKKYKIPYIILPHGSFTIESQQKKWFKKKVYRLYFLDKFVKNAAAIQYLSQGELDKTVFKHPNPFIGTNGINEHTETIIPQDKLVMTYIGRLDTYYKGIDLLCEACNIEKTYLENKGVIINLYGSDQKGLHQQIKQLINKWDVANILQVNKGVFAEEKKKVLLESSFFLQVSRSEGLPMGILEALSYGLPCIVTKGTNLSEVIKKYDAGWTCETTSIEIASAIKKAVEEKNLIPIKALNAKKLIHDNYSWDIVAKDIVEHYKLITGQTK